MMNRYSGKYPLTIDLVERRMMYLFQIILIICDPHDTTMRVVIVTGQVTHREYLINVT